MSRCCKVTIIANSLTKNEVDNVKDYCKKMIDTGDIKTHHLCDDIFDMFIHGVGYIGNGQSETELSKNLQHEICKNLDYCNLVKIKVLVKEIDSN